MKKIPGPSFSCISLSYRFFFLLLLFSFMAIPACTPSSEVNSLQESLLVFQKQQEEQFSELKQISEEKMAQQESLLQNLLANSREQQKAISQMRSIIAEYEKKENDSIPRERLYASASNGDKTKRMVAGVEAVRLLPPDMVFLARVDTGAETASLDARNIDLFERDGERWVRFDIPAPKGGAMIPMEQKLSRKARIIQASADEGERRLVVELSVTIGDVTQVAEFTLSDREHLKYPILIGRNILKDIMVVDVSLPPASIP